MRRPENHFICLPGYKQVKESAIFHVTEPDGRNFHVAGDLFTLSGVPFVWLAVHHRFPGDPLIVAGHLMALHPKATVTSGDLPCWPPAGKGAPHA